MFKSFDSSNEIAVVMDHLLQVLAQRTYLIKHFLERNPDQPCWKTAYAVLFALESKAKSAHKEEAPSATLRP